MVVSISASIRNFRVKAVIAHILCLDVCRCFEFNRWFIFFKGSRHFEHGNVRVLRRDVRSFTKVHWKCYSRCWPWIFVAQCLGWLWIAKRSRWEGKALEGRYKMASNLSKFQMRAVTMTHMFFGKFNKNVPHWFPYASNFSGAVQSTLPETNSKRTWKWVVGRRSFPSGFRPIFTGFHSFVGGTETYETSKISVQSVTKQWPREGNLWLRWNFVNKKSTNGQDPS